MSSRVDLTETSLDAPTPSKVSGGFVDLASIEYLLNRHFTPINGFSEVLFFAELETYFNNYGINYADTYGYKNSESLDKTKLFT